MLAVAFVSGALADDLPQDLPSIKRVYVDRLVGNESADQIRELIVASLHKSKLFVVTEDAERADAILKGAADEQIFIDQFQSSDGANMRTLIGAGTRSTGITGLAARSLSMTAGDNEVVNIRERKHEALATVRLVSRAGDVIWSTTQESQGGKLRGAAADVVEKVTRRLVEDMAQAKGRENAQSEAPGDLQPR